jgi:hypothetical protein
MVLRTRFELVYIRLKGEGPGPLGERSINWNLGRIRHRHLSAHSSPSTPRRRVRNTTTGGELLLSDWQVLNCTTGYGTLGGIRTRNLHTENVVPFQLANRAY